MTALPDMSHDDACTYVATCGACGLRAAVVCDGPPMAECVRCYAPVEWHVPSLGEPVVCNCRACWDTHLGLAYREGRAALLAERDQLRAEVERAHTDERRRIVAWIRHEAARGGWHTPPRAADLAEKIEAGEHEWPASMPPRVADALAVAERLVEESDR